MVKRKIILTAFLMLLASPMLVVADTDISSCSNLNSANETYYLTQNITDSTSMGCMNITASNVTLDCQGYMIDGVDTPESYGIKIDSYNSSTIKNCILIDWYYGAWMFKSSNNNFTNNTAYSIYGHGIWVDHYSLDNIFTNNSMINNGGAGFEVSSYSDNNFFAYNIANNNYWGFYFSKVNNSIFEWNTMKNNEVGFIIDATSYNNTISSSITQNNTIGGAIYDTSNNLIYNNFFNDTKNVGFAGAIFTNYWNTTKQSGTRIYSDGTQIGGNYWTNSIGNGYSDTCTDSDTDGFCDSALNLTTNNWDYLPLSDEYVAPPTTTTTLGPIGETLTDIGTGVGGLLDQMGSPIVVFMILMGLVGGIAILFKGVFTRFSD